MNALSVAVERDLKGRALNGSRRKNRRISLASVFESWQVVALNALDQRASGVGRQVESLGDSGTFGSQQKETNAKQAFEYRDVEASFELSEALLRKSRGEIEVLAMREIKIGLHI